MDENKSPMKFIGVFVIALFVIGIIITISQLNNQTLTGYPSGYAGVYGQHYRAYHAYP